MTSHFIWYELLTSDPPAAATMGAHQVPTGDRISQARDPQGAMFALLGPKV